MAIFDEDKIISEQFLIEQGFRKYRKGYYERDYVTYRPVDSDPEDIERIIVNVFFSMKNNNVYVEKAINWERCRYWKHKVHNQLDFLLIITKYRLESKNEYL